MLWFRLISKLLWNELGGSLEGGWILLKLCPLVSYLNYVSCIYSRILENVGWVSISEIGHNICTLKLSCKNYTLILGITAWAMPTDKVLLTTSLKSLATWDSFWVCNLSCLQNLSNRLVNSKFKLFKEIFCCK